MIASITGGTTFSTLDYVIFVTYAAVILFIGLFVSRTKKGKEKTAQEYFLADKALPWWAIGATLIGSNISAEQFIGMSGTGFKIGLAVASYEWMAAATLIIVGKYLLPIFLKENIYTMPQFLEQRFDNRVRTSLAVFWLLVYVFVNLTSILYLGALSIEKIFGLPLIYGILGIAAFSALYSVYGGLEAVAWTDVVQVVVLIIGGLVTAYLGLNKVAELSGDTGMIAGFMKTWSAAQDHFHMIIPKNLPDGSANPNYMDIPGISVLVGGMWIVNMSYWGFNQYITQRAFAAKNLREAQKGVMFAGYLKLLMPLIVVVPGIVAYVLISHGGEVTNYAGVPITTTIGKPDEAYPWLLQNFLPTGLRGLAFAGLIAAIVAALSSMINSTATIFTMDIYKQFINKNPNDKQMVFTGRVVSGVGLLIAILVAPMLSGLDTAFQYIQEFTGFISPAVLAIFVFGFFWKRTTANAVLWAAVLAIPLGILFKFTWETLPFIDRMGVVFLILSAVIIVISMIEAKGDHPKAIKLEKGLFDTSMSFNIGSIGICAILAALYIIFW